MRVGEWVGEWVGLSADLSVVALAETEALAKADGFGFLVSGFGLTRNQKLETKN